MSLFLYILSIEFQSFFFVCFQEYCLGTSLVLFFFLMTNNDLSLEQTINKNESPDLLTALAAQNNGS